MKFFIYLTDVTSETGPHVYVRGSHREKPLSFFRDGRFDDAEVERYFGSRVTEVCGPAGTIFAADTKGLHKGKVVDAGQRLVLQLEFASSLFGQSYGRVALGENLIPELARCMRRHAPVFRRFLG